MHLVCITGFLQHPPLEIFARASAFYQTLHIPRSTRSKIQVDRRKKGGKFENSGRGQNMRKNLRPVVAAAQTAITEILAGRAVAVTAAPLARMAPTLPHPVAPPLTPGEPKSPT